MVRQSYYYYGMSQRSKNVFQNDLLAIWHSGVAAVQGRSSVNSALAAHQITRPDFVIAAGKAAASMAAAVHDTFGKIPTLIVTKYGHTEDAPKHAIVVQSAHPVPDEASLPAEPRSKTQFLSARKTHTSCFSCLVVHHHWRRCCLPV